MPQVSSPGARSVQPNPIPSATRNFIQTPRIDQAATAQSGGSEIGGVVAQMGSQILEQQQVIAAAARKAANTTAVTDAHNQLLIKNQDLLYGPQGALSVSGKDVLGLPDTVSEAYKKNANDIAQNLSNPEQKAAFSDLATKEYISTMEKVHVHADSEYRAFSEKTQAANMDLIVNAARLNADNPNDVQDAIDEIRQNTTKFGLDHKWSADMISESIDKNTSKAVEAVVGQANNDGNSGLARKYMEKYGHQIEDPKTQSTLMKEIGVQDVRAASQKASDLLLGGGAVGMTTAPTIKDAYDRKTLQNPDGTVSTASTIGIEEDGKEVVIPTVIDGVRYSNQDAIAYYKKTGEHFGKFDTAAHAEVYAEQLHNQQQRALAGESTDPTLEELLAQVDQIQDPATRDATEERVRSRYTAIRQDRNQQEQARNAAVKDTVDKHFQAMTNFVDTMAPTVGWQDAVDQIPPSAWAALPEAQKSAVITYAKSRSAKKQTENNFGVYQALMVMASDPATKNDFAKIDLNSAKYLNSLDDSHRDELVKIKAAIIKGDDKQADALMNGFRTQNDVVNEMIMPLIEKTVGTTGPAPKEAEAKIRQQVEQYQIQFQVATGKPASKQDLQGYVDGLIIQGDDIPGSIFGTFWTSSAKHVYELGPTDKMKVGGVELTKDEIVNAAWALRQLGKPETPANIAATAKGARK
jgi:metal-responsive CopG/Arc/MetJ family transcriptional regulator